jgi:hypothetical protein
MLCKREDRVPQPSDGARSASHILKNRTRQAPSYARKPPRDGIIELKETLKQQRLFKMKRAGMALDQ